MDASKVKSDWNTRYAEDFYSFGKEPNDFLIASKEKFPSPGSALCLAEGEGRNGVWLAQLGFEVTGVDLSEVGKQKALALASEKGVSLTFDVADLAEYDFGSEKWDLIISIFCHTSTSPQINSS